MPPFRRWRFKSVARASVSFAGLALLSACAGGSREAAGPTTAYYLAHAEGNYTPPGPASDPWGPYIKIAAGRFDVPEQWVRQVMHVESGGHQYIGGQLTVSSSGAMGLMQLEPETYQEMAARYSLGNDPFNPYDNIMAGTAYIHEMYSVYGSPGFLAAYNAGPGRLDSFMNYHRPLPDETTNYVAMIAPQIQGYYPQHRSDADQLALNTMSASSGSGILPYGVSPGPLPSPDTPSTPLAPVEVAALAPPSSSDAAYDPDAQPAPSRSPAPSSGSGFSLIPSAMADTPPPQMSLPDVTPAPAPIQQAQLAAQPLPSPPVSHYMPAPAPHYAAAPVTHYYAAPAVNHEYAAASGWAVQVGAYNTASKAKAALGIAELSAVQTLIHGRAVVASVNNGLGTVYRARFVGLPHEAAVDACQRLSGGPTGCVILSPDAQS